MEEREISVPTADGEMPAFTVHPETGGPFPVAVLYMDGVGYREQVKENARRFAAGGFYCVVPDLFYRSGKGITFDFSRIATGRADESERARMMGVVGSVTPEGVEGDTQAVLHAVGDDPAAAPGAKVCVGYCMGARFALHAASEFPDEFVAGAGIHPGALMTDRPDSPHRDLAGVRGELYFAFAEEDPSAPPELVDRFREELRQRGVRGEVERAPGTRHGFAMADLPVYDRDAAERHFERTLDLWRRNLS
ncbi:MAG: dienelactone hydrolase family protein [Candidatus Dormibacteraeota bacterium]|nr:dienelactone hydrolase family protein [Candidatus Dormibacteraeota bacterium]